MQLVDGALGIDHVTPAISKFNWKQEVSTSLERAHHQTYQLSVQFSETQDKASATVLNISIFLNDGGSRAMPSWPVVYEN